MDNLPLDANTVNYCCTAVARSAVVDSDYLRALLGQCGIGVSTAGLAALLAEIERREVLRLRPAVPVPWSKWA